ncbi:MAG: RNA polymerase sigma factor [Bacteroides sp.]
MIKTTDDHIIELIKNPKSLRKGFHLLVSTYSERIYWHVRRIVLTHEDANDTVQNTFMKAWMNIESFRGDAKLSTWLYRIAVNESLNLINRDKDRHATALDDPDLALENQLKSDPYFDGDELDIEFQKAINNLPEKQRLVFTMRYYDGLKYQDISTILGTSVGGLKASYHHALKKIEEHIRSLD